MNATDREVVALCIEATKAGDLTLAHALRSRLFDHWFPPRFINTPDEYEQVGWRNSYKALVTLEAHSKGGGVLHPECQCEPVYVKRDS